MSNGWTVTTGPKISSHEVRAVGGRPWQATHTPITPIGVHTNNTHGLACAEAYATSHSYVQRFALAHVALATPSSHSKQQPQHRRQQHSRSRRWARRKRRYRRVLAGQGACHRRRWCRPLPQRASRTTPPARTRPPPLVSRSRTPRRGHDRWWVWCIAHGMVHGEVHGERPTLSRCMCEDSGPKKVSGWLGSPTTRPCSCGACTETRWEWAGVRPSTPQGHGSRGQCPWQVMTRREMHRNTLAHQHYSLPSAGKCSHSSPPSPAPA